MATGLLALLDDVAALVKVTAAALDDIPSQVAKAGGKVTGVVIDDAAVTPKYVVGLDPKRELIIIYHIARRSLINKVLLLAPAALLLGYFAPWVITPILMLGGCYLCFEGYEKVHSMHARHDTAQEAQAEEITPQELEEMRIDSAVRTDLILSAEIIAITYAMVAHEPLLQQGIVVYSIAVAITLAVYGFVGLIVKADDVGVYLVKNSRITLLQAFGRGLVKAMPVFFKLLSLIGTFAMLWVGAEIIAHGIPVIDRQLAALKQHLAVLPVVSWAVKATLCALGGLVMGGVIAQIVLRINKYTGNSHA